MGVKTAHLVHVEDEVQLTDVFKAFVQRFHKHLQEICPVKRAIEQGFAQGLELLLLDLGFTPEET